LAKSQIAVAFVWQVHQTPHLYSLDGTTQLLVSLQPMTMKFLCWWFNPKSPYPYTNVSLDPTSAPAKWHLNPSNVQFKQGARMWQTTEHATEKCTPIGKILSLRKCICNLVSSWHSLTKSTA